MATAALQKASLALRVAQGRERSAPRALHARAGKALAFQTARKLSGCRQVWQGKGNVLVQGSRRSLGASSSKRGTRGGALSSSAELQALVFDCDGVILESEGLHRRAYNAAFEHFKLEISKNEGYVNWSEEFYDQLQNKIGGGKPKMRWYFGEKGWPSSTVYEGGPKSDEEKAKLIDTIQDWKTSKYQEMIGSGEVPPRPGVIDLIDEAFADGLKVAVCSAATKSSVVFTLKSLLGKERFQRLDCFLAGDDVSKKKPDPTIYKKAAEVLAISPNDCLVVEDSVIGLQAATGAGMPCIITYTPSTQAQAFEGAVEVYPDLGNVRLSELKGLDRPKEATFR